MLLPVLVAAELLDSPQAFRKASLTQIKQQYEGRPFMLVLWSLECPSCFQELKHLAEVRRDYPKLPLVLVATDSWAERGEVIEALAEMGLTGADSWLFAGDAQALRFSIDSRWRGELPRSYLYSYMHQPIVKSGLLSKQEIVAWWQLKRPLSH